MAWQKGTRWFAVRQYLVPAKIAGAGGGATGRAPEEDAGDARRRPVHPAGVGVSACPYLFVLSALQSTAVDGAAPPERTRTRGA